jgi:hypothetical protein
VKPRRLLLLAVAGTSMLALSGCAQSGNVAAQVGGTTVTNADVNFLTQMQCDTLKKAAKDPAQAQGAQVVPTSLIRTGMVNALVEAELNRQLADREHASYDKATLRTVMDQFEPVVAQAPAKDRERFRDLVSGFYRGQLRVYALAQQQLSQQGITDPTSDQVDKTVAAIQDTYRKSVKVEVNPEYGPDAKGVAGAEDPSLSVPLSSFAKQARSSSPKPTWVSDLPADQRCG